MVMISVGAVIVYVSGIYSTIFAYSQYPPQNPYVCASAACGISTIFAVGGLGVILLGLRGLWRFLNRTGYVQLKRPGASPQIGLGPEDEKVLAIGREAFGRVKQRRRRKTEAVYWSENAGWYWCHPTGRGVKPLDSQSLPAFEENSIRKIGKLFLPITRSNSNPAYESRADSSSCCSFPFSYS